MPLDGSNYQPCKDAAILREAANLIRKEGWSQGYEHDENGFCIGGAILYTEHNGVENGIGIYLTESWNKSKGIELLRKFKQFRHYDYLIDWNNERERTKEEVIEALEGAAKFAEEKAMETVV